MFMPVLRNFYWLRKVKTYFVNFMRSWHNALKNLMLKAEKWEKLSEETEGKL